MGVDKSYKMFLLHTSQIFFNLDEMKKKHSLGQRIIIKCTKVGRKININSEIT